MAQVCRHDCLPLRVAAVVMMLCCLFCASVRAQSLPDPSGQVSPLPAPRAAAPAPHERVLDIRVVGNRTISTEKVLANIGTRVDQPFDQSTFDKDVKKLVGKNWFVNVVPHRQSVQGGVVITLEVVERPVLEDVQYHGCRKIKAKVLAKQTGLKKGDSLDPFAVEEAARKIETFYQSKGHADVKVTVMEGNKPSDRRAVFIINEGKAQKIWKVQFEGNGVASDARLRTQIQSKPPLFWFIKGYVDRKKIDEDVERLTDYYRALGYFKATVGRDWQYDEDEDWMTLTFYINEGPRYTVRDISFIGNTIYDRNILSEGMKLKPGDFYDRAKMNADIGYIKDLYGSYGYVFADAQFDLQFDEQPGPVDILYRLTEGQQCVVGDINVHIAGDNPHTRLNTAINRLGLRPGDVIDIRKVRASERRLKSSNLFENDPTKGDVPRIVLSPPDPEDPSGNKSKRVARESGDPNAVRGQSLDPPRQPQPTARAQSPDAYGGYGGTSVGQITPEPQAYSNQQPSRYTAQQPAGQQQSGTTGWQPQGTYTAQQPGGYSTQPPIVGAPPAGTIYPPNYAPPAGQYAQGGYAAPNTLPPPGSYPPVVPGGAAPGLAPEVIAPPDDRPRIPLDIYLNEAQTGRFMFGAGVNSNAGLVGSIILDEQNFDWRRFPTSWEDIRSGRAWRGGGQKFRLEAAPGTEVSRYMFNFGEPYLFDTPVSFGLSGYYFQRFYRNWNEQRAGGRTSLGYLFTPDLSGSLSFRGEDILISNPSTDSVALLNEALGHTQIYSFKGQVAWDTRDSTFLPTEGHYISLDVAYAVGTFQFPTYTVDFRKFFLLRERPDGSGRHVLSLYNQFGITGPDTPIYERFYAGGFSTLRGFQFRGASPQINTVEVGGDFQNLSSVEYMFPITADDMLRMVMFVDFGTVEQSVTINWDDFRVAPGFGFRISLPALGPAPIALDLAFPVAYADTDIKQIFSFFVGYSR